LGEKLIEKFLATSWRQKEFHFLGSREGIALAKSLKTIFGKRNYGKQSKESIESGTYSRNLKYSPLC